MLRGCSNPRTLQPRGLGRACLPPRPVPLPSVAARLQRQNRSLAVQVRGDLSAKGKAFLPSNISVQRIMGEGSFGQVFEGFLDTASGQQRVVLKRVKTRVEGAEEMGQMEHLLNVYASRVARGHCADFLGYCEVPEVQATARLTAGLWLVWKYEGNKTLSYYLRRRDTTRALAQDLAVPESAVIPTVMKQVFEGLAAFHAAGLVHRDIKPLNIIFTEEQRRFKLIDLGACADLRSGTNYIPGESILDLNYCPPEQYVMPTDSPHLSKHMLKMAISPMLWAKHKPDRFDTWSAGILFLQLAIPATRTDRALRQFNAQYGPKYKYDLQAWRKGAYLTSRDTMLLDADDGAGWDLLQSLLSPRHIQVDDQGRVAFVNDTPFPRISAYEALKHRYLKGAAEPGVTLLPPPNSVVVGGRSSSSVAAQSSEKSVVAGGRGGTGGRAGTGGRIGTGGRFNISGSIGGSLGSYDEDRMVPAKQSSAGPGKAGAGALSAAVDLWQSMTGRLFDLEAKLMKQASATEVQTTTVKRLKEQVNAGKASPEVLNKEERVLNKMQRRLAGLQDEISTTANQASGLFGFLGIKPKQTKQQQQQEPVVQASAKAPASSGRRSGGGSDSKAQRLQQAAAASKAMRSGSTSSASRGSMDEVAPEGGSFSSMWERLSEGMAGLESKVSNMASATERQGLNVRVLQAKVAAGEAEPELLEKAQRTLSRMERRLLDLDQRYSKARRNAEGAVAGTASGSQPASNGKRGGSGDVRVSASSAASASSSSSSSFNSSSKASGGSSSTGTSSSNNGNGGGFWARLLGTPSRSTSVSAGSGSTSAAPAAPPTPTKSSPANARNSNNSKSSSSGNVIVKGSSGSGSSSSSERDQQQQPSSPSKTSTDALVDGASNLIASSLKFTGFAARFAVNVAGAIKADAEKYLAQMEMEAEAKKLQKSQDLAFLNMLRDARPPLPPSVTYEQAEAQLSGETAWQAIPDGPRRLQLFYAFTDALRKAEEQAAQAAEVALKALYRRSIASNSTWEDVRAALASDAAFLAVTDDAARQRLFREVQEDVGVQVSLKVAAKRAEDDFIGLLAGLQDPPITSTATWALVRGRIIQDSRCQAIPELRRRQLFETYTANLFEQETLMVQAEAAKAAAADMAAETAALSAEVVEPPAELAGTAMSGFAAPKSTSLPGSSRLEELKKEQARLRQEYEMMAAKLRDMDSKLKAQIAATAASTDTAMGLQLPSPRTPAADPSSTNGAGSLGAPGGGSYAAQGLLREMEAQINGSSGTMYSFTSANGNGNGNGSSTDGEEDAAAAGAAQQGVGAAAALPLQHDGNSTNNISILPSGLVVTEDAAAAKEGVPLA